MEPLTIALGIALLGGGAYVMASKKETKAPVMTPERKIVYDTAMAQVKEPEKLRALADAFEKEGLLAEAEMLRKRAGLRELPADVKEDRKDAFRRGMSSLDPAAVLNLANAFDKEGATGAADALRKYAATLQAGGKPAGQGLPIPGNAIPSIPGMPAPPQNIPVIPGTLPGGVSIPGLLGSLGSLGIPPAPNVGLPLDPSLPLNMKNPFPDLGPDTDPNANPNASANTNPGGPGPRIAEAEALWRAAGLPVAPAAGGSAIPVIPGTPGSGLAGSGLGNAYPGPIPPAPPLSPEAQKVLTDSLDIWAPKA